MVVIGAIGALFGFMMFVIALTGRIATGEWDLSFISMFLPPIAIVLVVGYIFGRYFFITIEFHTSQRYMEIDFHLLVEIFEGAMETTGIQFDRYTAVEYRVEGANAKWRREPPWSGSAVTGWYKYDLDYGELHASVWGHVQKRVSKVTLIIFHRGEEDETSIEALKEAIDRNVSG
jgi:hypothetical protein